MAQQRGQKRGPPQSTQEGQSSKRTKPDEEADEIDAEIEAADAMGEDEDVFLDEIIDAQAADSEATMMRDTWARPSPPVLDPNWHSLCFQQLDIDYVVASPDRRFVVGNQTQVPVLRMFGVTGGGNSACAHVHAFEPYFWAAAPPGFGPDDVESFKQMLNDEARKQASKGTGGGQNVTKVEYTTRKSTIWHYQKNPQPFLRVVTALPNMVNTCRGILEKGLFVPNFGKQIAFPTFESNVLFVLRFMIDRGIVGGNWIELPAMKYSERAEQSSPPKLSRCQYEVDVHCEDLISHQPTGEWQRIAPLRIMSLDIECSGRKGKFPESDKDPVIQIATYVAVQGESEPFVKNVITLKQCSAISGVEVLCYENERDLLLAWRDLLLGTDPDVVIGYNHCQFDLPYLINRAEALNLPNFHFWGRMKNSKLRMRDSVFSSRAYGTRESKEITIEGRLQFDLLTAIQRDHKLSSYSLNSVSSNFLGEQKEDVHHSQIYDLQWDYGNEQTRRRLAIYCLKDAYLPLRLLDKLKFLYNYLEMARVTGVPFSFLLSRGQSIKVMSQLLRKAQQRDMLIPNMPRQNSQQESRGVAYEGATVLDAKVGYYTDPVATLDFASLYPSIMMAHNICYCTLVPKNEAMNMSSDVVTKTPTDHYFVKSHVRHGILPEVLTELLNARKAAKKDLKDASDPIEKAVLNGRQLALKVSANSVYGFTGAVVGQLPCLEISSSVTAYGREMIEHTHDMVKSKYSVANGYASDAEVIYGDTDSVMIDFKVKDLSECMRLGEEAAEFVSETFTKPIRLEFEKCYWPYLLMNKKRYAGLLWTGTEQYDKMDTKGIETVRRDNCLLVRKLVETSLHKILVERDQQGAIDYVKTMIRDLLMNRLDLSLLVVTKALTRETENFEGKSAHVELAKRMAQRDPATAPHVGDRIPYVMVKAAKGAKSWEKSEDPIYALENNLPIDSQYYLEHHLQKPLTRIFEPILKNAERELFSGEHTRSISQPTPTSATSGIMKFAKVKSTCLGCRSPIEGNGNSQALCKHCAPREAELYQKTLAKVGDLEWQFSRLWSQCQRCQGSLHQDILCSCKDCPIFYRRKKVMKDLGETRKTLDRFEDW